MTFRDSLEKMFREKIKAYFWMMRPANCTTAAVAVFAALLIALESDDSLFDPITYLFISLTAFFTTAHSMVHNDIVDIDIDLINSPHRPIPSNIIKMNEAKIWSIILLIIACSMGLLADYRLDLSLPFSLFWAFSNALILDSYNLYFKKSGIWGNLIVGYTVWALFIYGDIIVNQSLTLRVESLGIFAFFWNWGREVIKDIIDIEGDKTAGMKTIAVRFGARGAAIIGSLLFGIAIIGTLPLILFPKDSLFVPYALIIINSIIVYRSIKLIMDPNKEYVYKTKLLYMRLMLLALIGLSIDSIYF